jgi:hypothetical protein
MTYALNLPAGEFFRNPKPLSEPLIHFGTLTYSRSVAMNIGGFDDITQSEDLRFAEKALLSCNNLLLIENGSVVYSRHAGVGSASNTYVMPKRIEAKLYGNPRHRVEAPEWVTAAMLENLIGAEQQSAHNRGMTPSRKVNDFALPRLSPWVEGTKRTPRMHPKCCADQNDPRCHMRRHRVAVLVTGVRERFIPMSTLHHVVAPARKAGFEVDYFADLVSNWNGLSYHDREGDPAIRNRSDSEIKNFVEKQALLLGASHAQVSLSPRDETDQLPDDLAWLGRYKSIERLWADAKQHAGTDIYTSVVVLRGRLIWTADIDTALLHVSSMAEIAYSLNCGQRLGHNDKALVVGGEVADDVLSMYTAWCQDQNPRLHHVYTAEGFLQKVAEMRYVPWEEVESNRLPAVVASHVKVPDALQPVLCISRQDSCGIVDSTSQLYPFCD